jgi:DNA topoisomerase-3
MKTLIITEKPSVAKDIAKILGNFDKEENKLVSKDYIITWAYGHLLELAEPHDYNSSYKFWTLSNLPIIPENFKLKPIKKSEKQLENIIEVIKSPLVSKIINACDAGREGELIFRDIYEYSGVKKPSLRLWLSSFVKEAVLEAFDNLKDESIYDNLAKAAKCRAEADWLVGINATRAVSRRCGDLYSIGRVQTPTLSILVEREMEIRNFKKRIYYELEALFKAKSVEYKGKWLNKRKKVENPYELPGKEDGEKLKKELIGKEGKVKEVKIKEVHEQHPLLYDLTELQRDANKNFAFTASKTLNIAQTLYEERKLITYPRTDSRYLPKSMLTEISKVLETLSNVSEYKEFAQKSKTRLNSLSNRVINDSKVTDHFAIIPTREFPDFQKLKQDERKIYDLIVKRFLCVFYENASYSETVVITDVMGNLFESKEKVLVVPGFKEVYNEKVRQVILGKLKENDPVKVKEAELKEDETKPKPRYTDATLLSAMQGAGKLIEDESSREAIKDKGIGTPATRAQIIERLIEVSYVEREGKNLKPTDKGIYLISLLNGIPLYELSKPELTGEWEKKLLEIEEGKFSNEEFMKEIINFTKEIIEKVKKVDLNSLLGEKIGICPICGGEVVEEIRAYSCKNEKCSFKIFKKIVNANISKEEAILLLNNKRTVEPIQFKSKEGKIFKAYLVVKDDGSVGLEFINNNEIINLKPLGKCPKCGSDIVEKTGFYGCSKEGCDFRISKIILGRKMKRSEIEEILKDKKSKKLSGFWSKKKKPFSASLKIGEDGTLKFDFE